MTAAASLDAQKLFKVNGNSSGKQLYLFHFSLLLSTLNPIALRNAKIVCNFGLFECNRVKGKNMLLSELCGH